MVCLAIVDSCSDEQPLSLAAKVEHGVEVAVADLDGEEVRAATAGTGHHHHAVTLHRLEAELDTAAPARRPPRQTEVRAARGEGDPAESRVGRTARRRPGIARWTSCVVSYAVSYAIDDHVDSARALILRQLDKVQVDWQIVARHHRLQNQDKDPSTVTFYCWTSSKDILFSVSLLLSAAHLACLEYLRPRALILRRLWRYISHLLTYLDSWDTLFQKSGHHVQNSCFQFTFSPTEKNKICNHQIRFLDSSYAAKMCLRPGLCPGPHCWSLQCPQLP